MSSEKEMISFTIPNQTCDVLIDGLDVSVDVYKFIDLSNLTPIVVVSEGATVDPPSGLTVDFTDPVTYTITAQDGSTASYLITINKNLSRRSNIKDFQLIGTEQIVEREGDNLFIYVPYETDVTSIATEIAISDKATITPESGVLMNFTNPQTYTVTASDGSEKSFLVVVKKSPWRNVIKNGEAPFLKTDGHRLVVFKNKMWLLGGWLGAHDHDKATTVIENEYWTSQVWCTSNGINWESKGNAPWRGRHGFGAVVHDDKLWVIVGDDNTDVWNTEDGEHWNKIMDDVPFGRRSHGYIVSFNGKIWVMGGVSGIVYSVPNDVWSTVDGFNWQREVQNAPWIARGGIIGQAVLNNRLFLVSGMPTLGSGLLSLRDVWHTDDGILWKQTTHQAEWIGKMWHNVVTYNNKLWMISGDHAETGSLTNEVWFSSDGASWTEQKHTFLPPRHAAASIEFNNKLWLIGGLQYPTIVGGNTSNDVWVMDLNN